MGHWGSGLLDCNMGGFKVAKVFVVEDFEGYAVGVPWCASTYEFAVSCS
jgi:hypothetical protein